MSVPILKQGETLIASIVSALTDDDLVKFRDDLAHRIGMVRARGVVIDVTALDVLDSFATRTLRNIALTARLRGAETLYLQVDAAGADAAATLARVPGVTRIGPADQRPDSGAFEVETERGRDIRRDLAREVVTRGWGLLELRPMRMSLEEVFLQVTTEELPAEAAAAPAATAEGEAPRA